MKKGFNSKKKYKEINIGPFVVRIDLQNFNVNYDLLLYQGKIALYQSNMYTHIIVKKSEKR